MTLYIFELTFQCRKARSNPSSKTLDIVFLLGLVRLESSLNPNLLPMLPSVLSPEINGISCIFPSEPENTKTKQHQTNNNVNELIYVN